VNHLIIKPLDRPVKAEVTIPGSKSYTNRALLLAALAPRPVKLVNPLDSDDTRAMAGCLQSLGLEVINRPGSIDVIGGISAIADDDYDLYAGLSGTTMRFVLALCAVIPGRQTLRGGEGLQKRPIGELVDGLRQLGAKVEYLKRTGFPPLLVSSSSLTPGTVKLNGSESSQYISALLMVAPVVGGVTIKVQGELISKPFADMTIEAMRQFGAKVTQPAPRSYLIAGRQTYDSPEYIVEGDVSSASYFFAIAALTGSTLTLKNLNPQSIQADMGFLKILAGMGNELAYGQNEITITGKGVRPVNVDMRDCPDQAQTLAVLAAFAKGMTTVTGIQSLRIKETERIVALQHELRKMGIETSATPDSLTVHGGRPQAASITTYGDHRMAMAFAVAGTKLPGMEIQDPDVVTKTFPEFWDKLEALGIATQGSRLTMKIVLIGFMATGKSSVAPILAARLGLDVIEMDDLIVKKSGRESITEIFEIDGEAAFREFEKSVGKDLQHHDNVVISTGGGVVMDKTIIGYLADNAVVIELSAPFKTLLKRISPDIPRPLFADVTQAKALYKLRRPLYSKYATIDVATGDKSIDEVAEEIVKQVHDL
jgi:3-phosphoshikimate 1-carboxyvinyltransferase